MFSWSDDLPRHLLWVNALLFEGTERRHSNMLLDVCSICLFLQFWKKKIKHIPLRIYTNSWRWHEGCSKHIFQKYIFAFEISHSLATPASKTFILSKELHMSLCSMYWNSIKQGCPTGWKGRISKHTDFLVIIVVKMAAFNWEQYAFNISSILQKG